MTTESSSPVVAVIDGDVTIRPMRDSDDEFAMFVAWRNHPHVREWWDPDEGPETVMSARAEYEADVRGETATVACIIEQDRRPVGFVQAYPWRAYPDELAACDLDLGAEVDVDAWGMDIFIGEPDAIGRGVGRIAVRALCRHLVRDQGASEVVLGVAVDNERARRAYAASGFVAVREYLDTDTRGGERVTCTLMVWRDDA